MKEIILTIKARNIPGIIESYLFRALKAEGTKLLLYRFVFNYIDK